MASAPFRTDPRVLTEEDIAALREADRIRKSRGLPGIGQELREFVSRHTPPPEESPAIVVPTTPVTTTSSTIRVWRTIAIGGKSRDELLAAIESADYRVGDRARDMVAQKAFTVEVKQREVDIAVLSVAELRFLKGATTRDIWGRAEDLGLELCPPSVGPHLCLAYADQPLNDWFWVAMEQVSVFRGYMGIFKVARGVDGRWLLGINAGPDVWWDPGNRFAFVVPRK